MFKQLLLALSVLLVIGMFDETTMAQRGRGGGGRPGGMTRPPGQPGGGGMARPQARPQSRPAGMTRPAVQPGGGGMPRPQATPGAMARPGGTTRPAAQPGGNRPTTLPGNVAGNRPGGGGANRPTTLPGNVAGNRPGGGGANRPTTLPGNVAGNRPGGSGSNRPTTLPGSIAGNRPGGGGANRPTTLPGNIAGNRPGIGGGNRPTTLPGNIGGNRPGIGGGNPPWGQGNRPGIGGGNRPGIAGDNRPSLPGGFRPGGNNRPGVGNRPGIADNRPGLGNNRPGGGNLGGGAGSGNIGSGNISGGNNVAIGGGGGGNNVVNVNNNNVAGGGGWFGNRGGYYGGGGYGGGGYGYGGWGGGGWGGGYYGPAAYGGGYYGNWYNGCWNRNNWGGFWGGVGVGAMTTWGLSALYNPLYAYNYGMSSYFPTWGAYGYSTWGLSSLAGPWLYSGYSNPYITPQTQTIVIQQPVAVPAGTVAPATPATAVAYDYSKPIGVTDAPPEPGAVDTAQDTLTKARESFRANDYSQALALADQALAKTPNDPILHEFRALVLFALKRYDEAAATAYAVLAAGPGWNWATMVGLYPDLDTYSNQLRELEASVRQTPNLAPDHFLLAYHYMVQGHKDSAASEFQNVVTIEPTDQLAARFAAALGATVPEPPKLPTQLAQTSDGGVAKPVDLAQTAGSDTAQATTAGESSASADVPPPPAPPQNLLGKWSAKPNEKTAIALSLNPDGTFTWTVTQDGKSQTLEGWAGYQDQILTLAQEQGPPLVGKVAVDPAGNRFAFKPPGTPDSVAGLSFEKAAAVAAPATGS
ncbi:MAG: tetratricopeptide repeat protein [Isosphaeraceae bacterium]